MKSRWMTYLLLAAVAAVWGVVAWRILTSASAEATPPPVPKPVAQEPPVADTLWLDYPDPFLWGNVDQPSPPPRAVVRNLPPPAMKVRREKIRMQHLGTITAKKRTRYIFTIANEQYEIERGEAAGEFTLTGCDGDSIYLTKQGLTYGVKRCE